MKVVFISTKKGIINQDVDSFIVMYINEKAGRVSLKDLKGVLFGGFESEFIPKRITLDNVGFENSGRVIFEIENNVVSLIEFSPEASKKIKALSNRSGVVERLLKSFIERQKYSGTNMNICA